jgi:hypothetical protein
MNSLWKIAAVAVLLVIFACIGIAHVISPDRFIKRSGVRKDGELLTDFNRFQFRLAGAVFTALAVYLLYVLLRQ